MDQVGASCPRHCVDRLSFRCCRRSVTRTIRDAFVVRRAMSRSTGCRLRSIRSDDCFVYTIITSRTRVRSRRTALHSDLLAVRTRPDVPNARTRSVPTTYVESLHSARVPLIGSIAQGSDETVRVIAMNKNYHVDCYRCEVRARTLSPRRPSVSLRLVGLSIGLE